MAAGALVHRGQRVVADLVPEAARARVEQDRDVAGGQAEARRGRGIEDLVHHADLREVVAGAERAELGDAALARSIRERPGVGAGQATAGFRELEVFRLAVTVPDRPRGAVAQHLVEVARGQPGDRALAAHAGGDVVLELADELTEPAAEIGDGQVGAHEADAAIDVVADAAGGDDALLRVERRDAADREPVPFVDVRHRQRGAHDAGQVRDVAGLHERLVAADRAQQLRARVDARRHPHPAGRLDLPDSGRNSLQLATHAINIGPGGSFGRPWEHGRTAGVRDAPQAGNRPRPPARGPAAKKAGAAVPLAHASTISSHLPRASSRNWISSRTAPWPPDAPATN